MYMYYKSMHDECLNAVLRHCQPLPGFKDCMTSQTVTRLSWYKADQLRCTQFHYASFPSLLAHASLYHTVTCPKQSNPKNPKDGVRCEQPC